MTKHYILIHPFARHSLRLRVDLADELQLICILDILWLTICKHLEQKLVCFIKCFNQISLEGRCTGLLLIGWELRYSIRNGNLRLEEDLEWILCFFNFLAIFIIGSEVPQANSELKLGLTRCKLKASELRKQTIILHYVVCQSVLEEVRSIEAVQAEHGVYVARGNTVSEEFDSHSWKK